MRKLIEQLDPVEDDAEITHLSLEVIVPPMFGHAAYAAGTARGMTHPAEAVVGYRGGRGDQIVRPEHRDRDTLTFFGMFMREGHRSARAQEIFDRVQQIHHDVRGVGNDLQLHVLGLLIFEPQRWVSDLGMPGWFSEKENLARFHFWQGVGRGMGLQQIPQDYDEFRQWVDEFEQEHFAPTPEARAVYRKQVEGFARWFPGPTKVLAHQTLSAGLSRMTRRVVDSGPVNPAFTLALAAGLRAYRATEPVRRVNLSRTWVGEFSRLGADPDLADLGYQHDVTSDPRYQRAGDPAKGYRYSVARGLESGGRPAR
ncbi:oxygenase MpaB family protein [Nocardia nova]|uniref:oxygenase MpaB family protein n=1 Tax=Nocardia nova TaxID=37330 RepID=UPI0015E34081|nr:oxygenase MpaB family protein [Nocardia nova]